MKIQIYFSREAARLALEECRGNVTPAKAQQILTRAIAHHQNNHVFEKGTVLANQGEECCVCPHAQPIYQFITVVPNVFKLEEEEK